MAGLLLATTESNGIFWNLIGTALYLAGAKGLGIIDNTTEPDTTEPESGGAR